MSTKKIIFLVAIGILGIAIFIGVLMLGGGKKEQVDIPKSITLWITEGSSEDYAGIIEGFKSFAPKYKGMAINIEKKTSDPIRYRTLLLSTLTDGTGPDIFMLSSGEDRVLEGKREPIPESILPLSNFEGEYEDIFLGLLGDSGSGDSTLPEKTILGVPLGYETLGIFYNKALLREIPKTWNEVDNLYNTDFGEGKYPTNLGLGPRYTPNASDVITGFVKNTGSGSYKSLSDDSDALSSYLNFQNLKITETPPSEDVLPTEKSSLTLRDLLEEENKTAYDAFMQGDIAMIVGYPSIVNELEKSTKRSGIDSVENLILTAPIPQESLGEKKKNIARYTYISISKLSENGLGAAKFLEYLMTDEGTRKFQEIYPYLIPPKPSLYAAWKSKNLSSILTRAKLEPFIPELQETLGVFDYGLKPEFDIFLSENIDRNENIDISNLGNGISAYIDCNIGLYLGGTSSPDCEKKE